MQDKKRNGQSKVLLNYYPCSYGDTLVAMFLGIAPKRQSLKTLSDMGNFKLPNFYDLSLEDKHQIWQQVTQPIMSCHRQYGFDYNQLEPVIVISICVSYRTWLCNRVMHVHWPNFEIGHPTLSKIRERLPKDQHYRIVETDYVQWAEENILPTDTVLDFEFVISEQMESWCQEHNLNYDPKCIEIIKKDLKNYQ